jgi:ribonuclease BN (tRNA processing enzyme)
MGPGVVARLQQATRLDAVDAIVISHGHPDHFLDLVSLRYGLRYGPGEPPSRRMAVWVAPGVEVMMDGLAAALGGDEAFWAEVFDVRVFAPGRGLEVAGIDIRFAKTRHYIDCWAMRLECDGVVLGYTADTGPCAEVEALVAGADLLVAEATLPVRVGYEHEWGHLAAGEAGALATAAGARALMLTHYWAECDAGALVEEAASRYGGAVDLARELEQHAVG